MEQCMICGKDIPDYKPQFCCDGFECGCMSMPIEPPICYECYNKLPNKQKIKETIRVGKSKTPSKWR